MTADAPAPLGMIATYGIPVPPDVIYAANTISAAEAAALRAATSPRGAAVELPALVRRAADAATDPLGPDVDEWLARPADSRPWLVIDAADARAGKVVAARVLTDPRLGARGKAALRGVDGLIADIDAAPLYGAGCRSTVVRAWTGIGVLALSGFGPAMPPRVAPALAELLTLRLESLTPTIIVETVPGRSWLGALASSGASPADIETIRRCIVDGLRL